MHVKSDMICFVYLFSFTVVKIMGWGLRGKEREGRKWSMGLLLSEESVSLVGRARSSSYGINSILKKGLEGLIII